MRSTYAAFALSAVAFATPSLAQEPATESDDPLPYVFSSFDDYVVRYDGYCEYVFAQWEAKLKALRRSPNRADRSQYKGLRKQVREAVAEVKAREWILWPSKGDFRCDGVPLPSDYPPEEVGCTITNLYAFQTISPTDILVRAMSHTRAYGDGSGTTTQTGTAGAIGRQEATWSQPFWLEEAEIRATNDGANIWELEGCLEFYAAESFPESTVGGATFRTARFIPREAIEERLRSEEVEGKADAEE